MKRKVKSIVNTVFTVVAVFGLFISPAARVARAAGTTVKSAAEGEIVAKLDFDPKINGFSFANYINDGPRKWQGDLGVEDLIRMFGPVAVCKSGTNAKDCVMKAAAHQWMMQALNGMNGGHCEGMAVTCLRFGMGLPFKSLVGPSSFQSGAKSTFGLNLNQSVANYIAYYFATQSFREVSAPTKVTAKQGPVAIVKMLINSMKNGGDTYVLGIYKCQDCDKPDGHAITPFAVEDAGSMYKIHVYDNNFPGETRYVTVDKTGKQTWKYNTATNPNEPPDLYTGNIDTATLEITASSLRDGKCFEAPFSKNEAKATGCGLDTAKPEKPGTAPKPSTPAGPAPKPVPTIETEGEDADFFLTGPGDMLIIDGDNKKVGFDPETGKHFNEIEDAVVEFISGGRKLDMPHYILPFDKESKPYTIVFSGRGLKKKSVMNFVYCGPGFSVGLSGIKLDPGEILVAEISPDGEKMAMAMSKDGEMPEIYYSIDTQKKSYSTVIKPKGLVPQKGSAGKTDIGNMKSSFDTEGDGKPVSEKAPPEMMVDFQNASKLQISDNIEGEGSYDVDLEQFDATGKKNKIQLKDVGKGDKGADNYEIEVGEWDGGNKIAVKHDDEGNGFDDDEEVMDENEENDIDDDPDKGDGGSALMSYIYSSINW